jgi:DNA-binding transcriptional MerR regulator
MTSNDLPPEPLDAGRLPPNAKLRSGTAARLAGLPVTTLRVWERRYGVVAAPKTSTGQRQYTALDVRRLALLKQLSDRGHAIGTIAMLPLDDLAGLAATAPVRSALPGALPAMRLVLLGASAGHRLQAVGVQPARVFDSLQAAAQAAQGDSEAADTGQPLVLVAHVPSLQPAVAEQALALAARWRAHKLVVLYAFGTEAVADSLRAAGALVRRDPCSGRDLLRLLSGLQPATAAEADNRPAARRFSDEALARLAEQPSSVACECPRHLAEIVLQLAHFERYSADCDAQSPSDAALHRHLAGLAGAARAMFEQALERVARSEGLLAD